MSLIAYGLARIGRDAELRRTPGNIAVCNLSLAFRVGRNGQDGKYPTQWVEGALWGKQAEALAPYLLKGGTVSVSIEDVHIEEFRRGDNTTGTKLTGRVLSIELGASAPEQAPAARSAPPARAPAPARQPAPSTGTGFDDMDSDIPFVSASAHFDMDTGSARRMARYGFRRKELV